MHFRLPRPHRIAAIYYFPRAFGFALTFVVAYLLYLEGKLSVHVLLAAVVQFLIYPHLMYLRACYAKNSKQTELQSLLIDAFVLGAWAAEFHYMLWLLFSLLMAVCLNNAMNGGIAGALRALVTFSAGNLAWGLMRGFHFELNAGLAATTLCMGGALMYVLNVAVVFHLQHRKLTRITKDIEAKNAIFQSLLAISITNYQAENIEKLFFGSLLHLKKMFPDAGFGVIVRDICRSRVIRNALFDGITQSQQEWLLETIIQFGEVEHLRELQHPDCKDTFYLLPMKSYLKQSDGLFIVRRLGLSDGNQNTITLFLDQMSAALENQLLAAQLKKSANTDALTGVFNRTYFNSEWLVVLRNKLLNQMIEFSVMMIDINGLKESNDRYGHESGDKLIQSVADLLLKNCRSSDVVVRFGGDEFLVLCAATSMAEAQCLLERIRQAEACATVSFSLGNGEKKSVPLSISIGVVASSECALDDILKLADERMYANKRKHYEKHEEYRKVK